MTTSEYIKKSLTAFKPVSQAINLYNPVIQGTSKKVFKIKDRHGNKYKVYDFNERIIIQISVKTSLLFSINQPNNVFFVNKILKKELYSKGSNDKDIENCFDLIKKHISNINFDKDEAIFVYKNSIDLSIKNTREILAAITFIQNIKQIIESNFPDIDETFDASKVPKEFKDLVPIIKKWSIADDVEREEKIKKSSKLKLKKIINLTIPKINLINEYLAGFKDEPMPHEAILLGNLAELVSELTIQENK